MLLTRVHTAITYEMLSFVKANAGALGTSKAEEAKVPKPVKAYLAEVDAATLMQDVRTLTAYLGGETGASLAGCKLAEALALFWATDFAMKLDKMTTDFYLLSQAKQREVVDQTIQSNSLVAETLKDLLVSYSYQEVAQGIGDFVRGASGTPYILVQSPREIDFELKKDVRDQLREEYGSQSFPVFQINKNLIGGMRIFVDGKVTDHSWLGRINYITSLTS